MAGPALLLKYLFLFVFYSFLVFLLYYAITRRNQRKSIPAGLLFLLLTALAATIIYRNRRDETAAAKTFLGDYKLQMLDGKRCDSCKVRLRKNYYYDILVHDSIVGHGKWQLETAIDIPGYFLSVENGPGSVIWEQDRLIEYIDRKKNK